MIKILHEFLPRAWKKAVRPRCFRLKTGPNPAFFSKLGPVKRISNEILRSNTPGAVSAQCDPRSQKPDFDCAPALWCQTLHILGPHVPCVIYPLHAEVFLVKLLGERKVEFCLLPHPSLVPLLCWGIIAVADVWKQQLTGNSKSIPPPP